MLGYTRIDPDKCEFVVVAPDADLLDGKRVFVEIDGIPIVLFRVGGKLFAIADACSHDDGPLGDGDLIDHEIICPRHGARFDIRTGKVLSLPAVLNIPSYPVRVIDHQIEVGLPAEL
jgi:3-phenylpropionate/trans-cinnamate dioxygenase ferredoxin subunit